MKEDCLENLTQDFKKREAQFETFSNMPGNFVQVDGRTTKTYKK